ncbi:MAG: hypothetical protein MJZ34_07080 [Paludibacteraceae bacterium]|nr:hypothetical protein [Paludibacteraceae bacterium]
MSTDAKEIKLKTYNELTIKASELDAEIFTEDRKVVQEPYIYQGAPKCYFMEKDTIYHIYGMVYKPIYNEGNMQVVVGYEKFYLYEKDTDIE